MIPTLFSLALAACAPAAPAAPAPAPAAAAQAQACAPVADIEREVGGFVARRLPDGSILLSPGNRFAFTPGAEDPATPPRWFEFVVPAGTGRQFEARTETLIAVPKGTVLELSTILGDIRVDGWNRNAVRVVAEHGRRDRLQARLVELDRRAQEMRRRAAEMRRRAEELRRRAVEGSQAPEAETVETSALRIETLNRLGVPAAVDYTITVPRWMAVRLSGMESDISVEGVRAAIAAESIRGDVRVRGGRGPVRISSVEGEVRAYDCDGDMRASSINSDVELDDVTGAMVIESVNGDIQIGKVKSRSVNASSVNGTVTFRGAFEPSGRYRLASHAGNLVVGVPVDAGVDVSVATFQGGFRTAFPVELGPWRKGEKFNFVLGSGGSSLELESFQGLIELLRPAEVPAVAPGPRPAPEPVRVRIIKTTKAPKAPKPPQSADDDDRDHEKEE